MAFAIPAAAAIKPKYTTYKYSAEYQKSSYYEQLTEAKQGLTGDQRYDIILIALSQLGYHEGDSDNDMSGWNFSGSGNFVEYNRLFGRVDGDYGFAWCAAFASWCQVQAGIPTDIDCTEVSCSRMINNILKPRGLYRTRQSGYIPLTGDLIYFRSRTYGGAATHVGLVIGTDGENVYTIEGNAGEDVARHKYPLDSGFIVGYGALDYKTIEGTNYSVFELVDESAKPGKYIIGPEELEVFAGHGTNHKVLGMLKKGDVVEITEFFDSWCWGKIKYNGMDAWITCSATCRADLASYTVKFDVGNGTFPITQKRKHSNIEIYLPDEIPLLEGHTFLGWAAQKGGAADYSAGEKYTPDVDATLYAVWEPLKFTVTFADHDGSLLASAEYDYGTPVTAPEGINPARETDGEFAYEFAGWDAELSSSVKSDLKYTATYTSRELTDAEKEALNPPQTTEEVTTEEITEEPPAVTEEEITTDDHTLTDEISEDVTTEMIVIPDPGGCGSFAAPSLLIMAIIAACFAVKKKES